MVVVPRIFEWPFTFALGRAALSARCSPYIALALETSRRGGIICFYVKGIAKLGFSLTTPGPEKRPQMRQVLRLE